MKFYCLKIRMFNDQNILRSYQGVDPLALVQMISDMNDKLNKLENEIVTLRENQLSHYLTREEAMKYCRISSETTFKKYIDNNMLKTAGSSGERQQLFTKKDLDVFIKSYK